MSASTRRLKIQSLPAPDIRDSEEEESAQTSRSTHQSKSALDSVTLEVEEEDS